LGEKKSLCAILSLINKAHEKEKEELFKYMVKSDRFVPSQFVASQEASTYYEGYSASELNKCIDIVQHMAAVNDKVLGEGTIYAIIAERILRTVSVKDTKMTAILGRLFELGVAFDQDSIDALNKNHPDYALTRQFLLDRLLDAKEPGDCN
jgi:hypothetical protein